MDDGDDSAYSRAPEFDDLVELCRSLNHEGVRYVLIGGFAVILHGFVRATKDIDLLIDPTEDNIRALKRAMAVLPDNAIALIEDDEVERYQVVRIADEFVVDLMASACGVDFAEAMRSGVDTVRLDDVDVPIAGRELLIRMKQTVRPSDAADVAFLRRLLDDDRD